jgi:hypothetical protein
MASEAMGLGHREVVEKVMRHIVYYLKLKPRHDELGLFSDMLKDAIWDEGRWGWSKDSVSSPLSWIRSSIKHRLWQYRAKFDKSLEGEDVIKDWMRDLAKESIGRHAPEADIKREARQFTKLLSEDRCRFDREVLEPLRVQGRFESLQVDDLFYSLVPIIEPNDDETAFIPELKDAEEVTEIDIMDISKLEGLDKEINIDPNTVHALKLMAKYYVSFNHACKEFLKLSNQEFNKAEYSYRQTRHLIKKIFPLC